MNKKIIGIIAVIVAVVVAVVCVVALGDKDTDSKKDNDKKTEAGENHAVLDPAEKDARSKTCLANQREAMAQLNTFAMNNCVSYSGTITYSSDGEGYSDFCSDVEGLDEETFCTLFQYVPVCPACGSYKIILTPTGSGDSAGSIHVKIECIDNHDGMPHATK